MNLRNNFGEIVGYISLQDKYRYVVSKEKIRVILTAGPEGVLLGGPVPLGGPVTLGGPVPLKLRGG